MRYTQIILGLLIGLLFTFATFAQEDPMAFEPFADTTFGVEWLRPIEWENAAPGVFARPPITSSLTTIIVQSAPINNETLQSVLTSQLAIDAFPEPVGEVTTDFATWTEYLIINEDFGLTLTVALSEIDGVSYIVILQSTSEEHETLREEVYTTVIASVALLETETEDAEASDMDAPYTEEEVRFSNGDASLAGTLTVPIDVNNPPVVVIVSGSGLQDRTGGIPQIAEIEPYTQIADHLARNGIAVLRYDDRGAGASIGEVQTADLIDFRDDANAAVNFLADRDQFSHIGIAGHSEGGVYAPDIALSNDNVNFVIGLAAPTVRAIDVARYQNQLILRESGVEQAQIDAIDTAYGDVLEALQADDEDVLRAAITELLANQVGGEPTEQQIELGMAQFQSAILQSYITYDPTPFWVDVDVPTLAIFGELDLQVAPEQNIPPIEDANENISIVTIPSMNHIFQEAETGLLQEYGTLEQTVMPAFLETLTTWILEIASQ